MLKPIIISCILLALAFLLNQCSTSKPVDNAIIVTEETVEKVDSLHVFSAESHSSLYMGNDSTERVRIVSKGTEYIKHYIFLADIPHFALLEVKKEQDVYIEDIEQPENFDIKTSVLKSDSMQFLSRIRCKGHSLAFPENSGVILSVTEMVPEKENLLHLYSLITGNHLITASGDYLHLTIPKTETKRFAGYQHHYAESLNNIGQENHAGIVYYSSYKKNIDRLEIITKDLELLKEIQANPPHVFLIVNRQGKDIRMKDLPLYPAKPYLFSEIPSGFHIEINYNEIPSLGTIRLSIEDDRIKIDELSHPLLDFILDNP